MRRSPLFKLALAFVVVVPALAFARHIITLGFGNAIVSGFPHGVVFVSGGGSYDPSTASNTLGAETFVHSNGGFSCLEDVGQGPLAGCLQGEGVRWDTEQLLKSFENFKCTGAAAEAPKNAVTDENTAVLVADFYRAGDGVDESFTARMILSKTDIAPDIEGIQNIWIQGVGCGLTRGSLAVKLP
jgi:hypothetical protein